MGSIFWFCATILFIIIELLTTSLVSIWFAISSVVLLIMSYFISNLFLEILIFCILSVVIFIISKPIYNKYFKKNIEKTNIYEIIGKKYILIEDITEEKMGKVKINDQIWNVISNTGNIEKGKEIIIEDINGTKLVVKRSE